MRKHIRCCHTHTHTHICGWLSQASRSIFHLSRSLHRYPSPVPSDANTTMQQLDQNHNLNEAFWSIKGSNDYTVEAQHVVSICHSEITSQPQSVLIVPSYLHRVTQEHTSMYTEGMQPGEGGRGWPAGWPGHVKCQWDSVRQHRVPTSLCINMLLGLTFERLPKIPGA